MKRIATVAALTAMATVTVAAGAWALFGPEDHTAIVTRVVDGDTLEARVDGQQVTVRLLNVDSPETKDPNEPVECMGPEASAFLAQRLPPGTKVQLEHDVERIDPYGRTLAAVYESGSLVNAEIAARGLGVAVRFAPNHRFFDAVADAQVSAEQGGRGLFSPSIECTLPAQVEQAIASLSGLPVEPPATVDEAADVVSSAGEVIDEAESVHHDLLALEQGESSIKKLILLARKGEDRRRLEQALDGARDLQSRHERNHAQLVEKERARAAQAAAAAKAEAEKRARAEAAAKAQAKAEAERRALSAAQQRDRRPKNSGQLAKRRPTVRRSSEPVARTLPKKTVKKTVTAKKRTTSTKASNPYPGYTGPRCYAPGGKTWRPC